MLIYKLQKIGLNTNNTATSNWKFLPWEKNQKRSFETPKKLVDVNGERIRELPSRCVRVCGGSGGRSASYLEDLGLENPPDYSRAFSSQMISVFLLVTVSQPLNVLDCTFNTFSSNRDNDARYFWEIENSKNQKVSTPFWFWLNFCWIFTFFVLKHEK